MANPEVVKQFGGKLLNIYTGGVFTKLIEVGYQVGLFEASRSGPATSEELSERAGLKERYVREWLGAMTTSGIYSYDPGSKRYALPEEHATLLTGDTAQNASPMSRMINHFGTHLPKLVACFRAGGGLYRWRWAGRGSGRCGGNRRRGSTSPRRDSGQSRSWMLPGHKTAYLSAATRPRCLAAELSGVGWLDRCAGMRPSTGCKAVHPKEGLSCQRKTRRPNVAQ